jgi:hypothetical protein
LRNRLRQRKPEYCAALTAHRLELAAQHCGVVAVRRFRKSGKKALITCRFML